MFASTGSLGVAQAMAAEAMAQTPFFHLQKWSMRSKTCGKCRRKVAPGGVASAGAVRFEGREDRTMLEELRTVKKCRKSCFFRYFSLICCRNFSCWAEATGASMLPAPIAFVLRQVLKLGTLAGCNSCKRLTKSSNISGCTFHCHVWGTRSSSMGPGHLLASEPP